MKHVLLTLLLLLVVTACGKTRMPDPDYTFTVRKGDSLTTISDRLAEDGVIHSAYLFRLYAKALGVEKTLKPGVYRVTDGSSYQDLIRAIHRGSVYTIKVTIPEGLNIFEIAALFASKDFFSSNDFVQAARRTEKLRQYPYAVPADLPSLDGYLFPDTYMIPYGYTANQVVDLMLAQLFRVIDQDDMGIALEKYGFSLNDVLILASIIQKETGAVFEMPIVSSVYHNRLREGMLLQADPTLIYALILDGEYTGDIQRKHLRPPYPSPYNTYYTKRLPPSPIAAPGEAAIFAAIYPTSTDYLYFVGKGDGSGTHVFSRTLSEHNEAVARYLQRL